jgi:serine protease
MGRKIGICKVFNRLFLEALEDRLVPAALVDKGKVVADPTQFSPDTLMVRLAPGQKVDYSLGAYGPGVQVVSGFKLLPDVYKAKVVGKTIIQAMDSLEPSTRVSTVYPDRAIKLNAIPNDSQFPKLWGMNNTGQTGGFPDADIDAPEAWDKVTGTGNTLVAVVDTGVDYNHPDLAANMWKNPGEIPGNKVDDDGNGYVDDVYGYDFVNGDADPMDDHGHGTHCAGTIGGVGDNKIGVTGVNWHTKIMAIKIFDASGSGGAGFMSGAIAGLDYAVSMKAKISNHSWGGYGFDSLFAQAVAKAKSVEHIIVAAAGNDSNDNDSMPYYPANYDYPNVVAVAATDSQDRLASFSSFGKTTVDIAAPGVNIFSAKPGGGYQMMSGTSMATPHIAGILSLYWDAYPDAKYDQIISALYQNADVKFNLMSKVVGGRRANVGNMLKNWTPPKTDFDGPYVTSARVVYSKGALAGAEFVFSEAINPATFTPADVLLTGPGGPLSVSAVTPVTGSSGMSFFVVFDPLTAPGSYVVKIGPSIEDLAGNPMDQDRDGRLGTIADVFLLYGAVVQNEYFDNNPMKIVDLDTVKSTIQVPTGLIIDDLNVTLNLTHTFDSDLAISLVGPDGTTVPLFTRRGGGADNLTGTMFDDQAAKALLDGRAPFAGAFRPEAPLSAFNQKDAKGTWTLMIADSRSRDVGELLNWKLTFRAAPDKVGAKVVNAEYLQANGLVSQAKLTFSEAIDISSLIPEDFSVVNSSGSVAIKSVQQVAGSGNTQVLIEFEPVSASLSSVFSAGPDILDLFGNRMDQNGNGINGEPGDVFTASFGMPARAEFSNSKAVAIPDLSTVKSKITVSSDLTIGDLNVRVNADHGYVADLVITLVAPGGKEFLLFNGRGRNGKNLVGTWFDDQASTPIASGVAPFTGAFRPEKSLAALQGANAKGEWTLIITDKGFKDSGTLKNWTLSFGPQASLAGSILASGSGGARISGAGSLQSGLDQAIWARMIVGDYVFGNSGKK